MKVVMKRRQLKDTMPKELLGGKGLELRFRLHSNGNQKRTVEEENKKPEKLKLKKITNKIVLNPEINTLHSSR